MNNIFIKNLEALAKKNFDLANKLQTFFPLEIPQLVQENNTYNLLYKDKLIHNKQNPLAEAQEIFSFAENTPVAIHLIYGLGLGYLFQIACNYSKGTVILYEPDLNILWTAFTLVDFSKDILKENVYICNTFDSTAEAIHQKSGTKNSPQLLSVPSQREYDKKGFDSLVNQLQGLVGSFSLDLKYTKQNFYPNLKTLMINLPALLKEIPLAKFKDAYLNKTAVIVSAGPTLDRNIETLKKYRDKYILFVVGTAAKTLYEHNIKPDFIVIIESYNSTRQLQDLDLNDVNFITEPYSHPALRNFQFKKIFSHISANSPINQFWAKICEEDIEEYWSKGTVSYTALNCARLLGCSKIILVGQDLAYIEGQCYSKDSAYKDLVCGINPENGHWEIMAKDFEKFALAISPLEDPEKRAQVAKRRLKNLNASLYLVKGINGDMLPTESVYSAFITPLQEYVENFNDRIYINTSLVGAQINGFKNMPLEDAIKDSPSVGNIELESNYKYNINNIRTNLEKALNDIKIILSTIEEGKQAYKTLNNELKRNRVVNEPLLKSLKKLSLIYLKISSEFSSKSEMFEFITISRRIDLDYEMKMLQDFTIENITNISNKIFEYLDFAEKGIDIINKIGRKALDESINSKS